MSLIIYSTARKNYKLGENIKKIVPVIKWISVKNKLLLQKFHTHFRYLYKLVQYMIFFLFPLSFYIPCFCFSSLIFFVGKKNSQADGVGICEYCIRNTVRIFLDVLGRKSVLVYIYLST